MFPRWTVTGTPSHSRFFRWSNIPLPEGHLALLGLSLILERRWSKPLAGRRLGWSLVVAGGVLAVWATRSTSTIELSSPARLVQEGPYRWSRHPMYLAWTLVYAGGALAAGSRWPLILAPGLGWWVRREVLREESRLIGLFGPEYLDYMDRVRRFV